MILPRAISHVAITVPDIDAAFAWYRDVLGCYVIANPSEADDDDSNLGNVVKDIFGEEFGGLSSPICRPRTVWVSSYSSSLSRRPMCQTIPSTTHVQASSTSVSSPPISRQLLRKSKRAVANLRAKSGGCSQIKTTRSAIAGTHGAPS